MKIFNLDCHIGSRDFKNIAENLGHEVVLESISDHNEFAGLSHSYQFNHYKNNWRNYLINNPDKFYSEFSHTLKDIDAFYCFYPSSFSIFFKKFDKPIIIHAPVRYENPMFSNEKLEEFKDFLKSGVKDGQILLCANNKLDQRHLSMSLNYDVEYIPSLCDYVKHKCSLKNNNIWLDTNRSSISIDHNKVSKLIYPYEDKSFFDSSGVIMLPYHNSTMAIFERYTANMPLFLPSKKYLMENFKKDPVNTMREISWFKLFGLNPKKEYPNSINNYLDESSMDSNFKLCDWIDGEFMKNSIQYDSQSHLIHLVNSTNLYDINSKMILENIDKKNIIYSKWTKLLKKVSGGL